VSFKGLLTLDMRGPKDQERATTAREDLMLDHICGVLIAPGGNSLPGRPIANRCPIKCRIGEDDAKIPLGRPGSIDISHGRKESLVHWRVPDKNVHSLPPHLSEALLVYRFAADISVYPILISRVSKLDHDVAAVRKEPRISDDRHEKIMELLIAMDLADCDQGIRIERTSDSCDSSLRMQSRPHRTLPIGC